MAQFVFGLVVIAFALVLLTLVLSGAAWIVLSLVRQLPLVGTRHRHARWEELNRPQPPDAGGRS